MLVLVLILFSLSCLVAALSFAFLDVWYHLSCLAIYFRWNWASRTKQLLEESVRYSWVLPADLDVMGHMNNARYGRDADLARYKYMFGCHLLQTLWGNKYDTVLMATSWRFRRSLQLWERFAVRTRMLGWDDHAFYLEQRFISCRDGCVCAVLLAQQHTVKISPSEVLQILYGKQMESPAIPEDIPCWLKSNQMNRERVKNEIEKKSKSK